MFIHRGLQTHGFLLLLFSIRNFLGFSMVLDAPVVDQALNEGVGHELDRISVTATHVFDRLIGVISAWIARPAIIRAVKIPEYIIRIL